MQEQKSLVKLADGRYSLQSADGEGSASPLSRSDISPRGLSVQAEAHSQLLHSTEHSTQLASLLKPDSALSWSNSSSNHKIVSAARRMRTPQGYARPQEALEPLGALAGEPELRGKLLTLSTTFANLDKQVEADTKRRKELEEKCSHELLAMLGRLEQVLATEAAERDKDFQSVAKAVKGHLDHMTDHLLGRLSQRFGSLSKSVESLTERCSNVERGIRQFKGELPSKLQVDTAALKHQIRELAASLAVDQRRVAEQDKQFFRRLEEVKWGVDTRMQQELAHLERRGEALQELIDQFAASEDHPQIQVQKVAILTSLGSLKEALFVEASEREVADDKVVQAINEYTSTLHRSLKASNA